MKKKLTILLLFGGQSAEHEVSIMSARNVAASIERNAYEMLLVYITRRGLWHHVSDVEGFIQHADVDGLTDGDTVFVTPGDGGAQLVNTADCSRLASVDLAYPVLHGPCGEDGTIQGLFTLLDIPFVGAGVTGSAVGMDKDVMNRLLREGGIPVPEFLVFSGESRDSIFFESVSQKLGTPLFVKPANLGSSVGISIVEGEKSFQDAVEEAFRFDRKIIIEESVQGREIECSVLGNENPTASVPGEIKPTHSFYSYDAKYVDDRGAELIIPAVLDRETTERVQELAVRSFSLLCCEGLARVDFFVREGGEVLVNEINTLPGFTNISMYPKLWEASGISQPELVGRLIALALDRHEQEAGLRRERGES
jgi:D-alanine-D-alanine ligase